MRQAQLEITDFAEELAVFENVTDADTASYILELSRELQQLCVTKNLQKLHDAFARVLKEAEAVLKS